MNYKKLNNYIGWFIFLIATFVYFVTIEETASLWDCGEFIATAYKLEVGHPPGAPFFMLVGRVFSLFAGSTADVALWINRMSALSSSFSILFLFWSITMLGKKIAEKDGSKMSSGQKIAILGSGVVGALVYTFTESFWFSAVEAEVYAMSSLFTAAIFWAALKWDEETTLINRKELSSAVHPLRWMILIMFLIGLAIGVHLLGLLVLPAIGYIIAHQRYEKTSLKLFVLTGIISIVVLAFIQNGVIPGSIALASKMEIFFRNSIGLPFGVGAMFFFMILIGGLIFGLIYTKKKGFKLGNTIVLGLVMILIGYGSFATIIIRSDANPPLDENNPENLVTLHAFLKREQYGSWPLLHGPHFNSKQANVRDFKDRSETYDRRWIIYNKNNVVTSFKEKSEAEEYIKNSGVKYDLEEKYFVTNEDTRKNQIPVYTQNTLFPRMYVTGDANVANGYKSWSGYNPDRKVPQNLIGTDGRPLPTAANNLTYLINYQLGWMYWRYFMWNFAGRQNDIQGHGDEFRGNWISGFNVVDNVRLGAQGENAPYFTQNNASNYKFYFIPIVLGLIGMFFHFLKAPKDAIVVSILFIMTGFAIILYLNQKPFEPRERDYAYAASFYTFAIWIGLGVYGMYEAYRSFAKEEYKLLTISYGTLLLLCLMADINASRGMPATISILIIGAMGIGAMALMTLLREVKASNNGAAFLTVALGLIAPIIMGVQNWEGHNRSNRTSTKALAHNYLIGCSPNAILYTNGDNDTFPLWYLQEVEEERTDVRVANLSLMQTDWYSNQMKKRVYESDPLPIKFREDQILMGAGNTDYVLFVDYEVYRRSISQEKSEAIIKKKIESNGDAFKQSLTQIRMGLASAIPMMEPDNDRAQEVLDKMKEELELQLTDPGFNDYQRIMQFITRIFSDVQNGVISANKNLLDQIEEAAISWTNAWDYLPLDYAMEFVREDTNMLQQQGGRKLRFFPSSGFILPVNAENAVEAGIFTENEKKSALKEIRFNFKRGGLFRSDVNGLSREEVMMLDILANFDWKRGIYFSSPGGSDVAKSLYARGVLANFGQTHGLLPLNKTALEDYSREKMYENIMEKYYYGNLKSDGVLVDYYTRRHTSQYRSSFLELASMYAKKYEEKKRMLPINDSIGTINQENAQQYADKVEEIISFSLKELPIDRVLDFGEPRETGRRLSNGDNIAMDGSIPDYISILYQVGKNELADQLALDYLRQLETFIRYFQHTDALIAHQNKKDFIAFSMNFLRTYAQVLTFSPDSPAAEFAHQMDQRMVSGVVGGIVEGLKRKKVKEIGRGGKVMERTMEKEAMDFIELYNALLKENGFEVEAEN